MTSMQKFIDYLYMIAYLHVCMCIKFCLFWRFKADIRKKNKSEDLFNNWDQKLAV